MSNDDTTNSDEPPQKIAVACQGGGSHTAFTAGVLKRLLTSVEPERFVGFSGASGGAACALLAWYGLHTSGPERATELLDGFWDDVAARTPWERAANQSAVNAWRMQDSGLWTFRSSPYDWGVGETAREFLQEALVAQVDFDRFGAFDERPTLHVSAVDVNAGRFRTYRNDEIRVEHVLASMAVPSLFPAVELPTPDGTDRHYHWDGLFSQNPPIRNFLEEPGRREEKPDGIWIVQVDPQRQVGEPRTLSEIADRRDELSANLSLNQEVFFIRRVNEWVEEGDLSGEYKRVGIRRIQLVPGDETEDEIERAERIDLSPASKLDRSPTHLRRLEALGDRRAGEFLETVRPVAPT
jgi:NTE family protein